MANKAKRIWSKHYAIWEGNVPFSVQFKGRTARCESLGSPGSFTFWRREDDGLWHILNDGRLSSNQDALNRTYGLYLADMVLNG